MANVTYNNSQVGNKNSCMNAEFHTGHKILHLSSGLPTKL